MLALPIPPCCLSLDGARNNALNDVLLAGDVQQDDGDDGDDDAGHHGSQLYPAIAATEILDRHGDGAVFFDVQHQGGQQVVVPDPHGLQDSGGDHGGFQDGEYDAEEDLYRVAAVDHGGFFDLDGDALHKAGEHKHGQARTKTQVDDADVPRSVQLQGVGGFRKGEHHHLEGDDHGEHDQQIHELAQFVVYPGQVPAGHGAAQQDQKYTADGDHQAVQQTGEEVHLHDAVNVVGQARKGFSSRQLEHGGGGKGALFFQAVQQDQHNGVDPEQAQQGHEHRKQSVDALFLFDHYACTSLERVILSWIREMTTTIRKNTTAFAWPMPFHCAPERP